MTLWLVRRAPVATSTKKKEARMIYIEAHSPCVLPLRDGSSALPTWKMGTGLRYARPGLLACNRLQKRQTGTRPNALLHGGGGGTVIAQQC